MRAEYQNVKIQAKKTAEHGEEKAVLPLLAFSDAPVIGIISSPLFQSFWTTFAVINNFCLSSLTRTYFCFGAFLHILR